MVRKFQTLWVFLLVVLLSCCPVVFLPTSSRSSRFSLSWFVTCSEIQVSGILCTPPSHVSCLLCSLFHPLPYTLLAWFHRFAHLLLFAASAAPNIRFVVSLIDHISQLCDHTSIMVSYISRLLLLFVQWCLVQRWVSFPPGFVLSLLCLTFPSFVISTPKYLHFRNIWFRARFGVLVSLFSSNTRVLFC